MCWFSLQKFKNEWGHGDFWATFLSFSWVFLFFLRKKSQNPDQQVSPLRIILFSAPEYQVIPH
jgi:hypothetical protein